MSRIDLGDVTFIIPLRVDSRDRASNFYAAQNFLMENFDTHIHVLEADREEKLMVGQHVKKQFVFDDNLLFRKALYVNQLAKGVITPYIALWDADVIGIPSQIEEGVNLLRNNKADMVYPFDKYFYSIPKHIKDVYVQTNYNLEVLTQSTSFLEKMHGDFSPGGAFIIKKEVFYDIGLENSNFFGWGPEDAELLVRLKNLGYRVNRIDGSLFHLHHERRLTSLFGSEKIEIMNRSEFIQVCAMHPVQLRNYVDNGFRDNADDIKFIDVLNKKVSVISDDCWAGQLYKQLNIEYLTPTVGMYILGGDYLNFISNLKSQDSTCFEQVFIDKDFPVGKTPCATFFFQHFDSYEKAIETFKRRYNRIVWEQIFVKIDLEKSCYKVEHIAKWNELRIPNSVAFYSDRVLDICGGDIYNGVYIKDWVIDGAKMFDISLNSFNLPKWLLLHSLEKYSCL